MKNLKFLFLFLLSVLSLNAFSQMGVTSYSIYALGINTSQNKRISGEIKTFANRSFRDILLEADVFYNFKPKPYHRFSLGIGVNITPFQDFDRLNAFTIPLAIELYPLQNFKKFSLLFELTPEILIEHDPNLRSLWGIRYTFGD